MNLKSAILFGLAAGVLGFQAGSQTVVTPPRVDVTEELIQSLKVPDGFKIDVFAQDLGKPRMMRVGADGSVYVSRREQGDILRLVDADGDGVAEQQTSVLALPDVHGMEISGSKMYVATVKELYALDIQADGSLINQVAILTDLPDGGQHPNRTIMVGPDGVIYLSIGSTCNACEETNEEHATIIRLNADGSGRTVHAKGLRNTLGFDFHPVTGQMWGMDHGTDTLGSDLPGEELNLIEAGADYGWPWIVDDGVKSKLMQWDEEQKGMTFEEYAATVTNPQMLYTAHASPIGFVFYEGSAFPERYKNGVFISFRGSWNADPAVGFEVVFVPFQDGQPMGFEPFVSGFLINEGEAHFARPTGIAVAQDGALLFADDSNGVIYRVSQK